jgi:hypothetical protein
MFSDKPRGQWLSLYGYGHHFLYGYHFLIMVTMVSCMSTSNQAVRYVRHGLDFMGTLVLSLPSAAMVLLKSRFCS